MYRGDRQTPTKLRILPPHPRWRWLAYTGRWMAGGCWSCMHHPIQGLLYGTVFVIPALCWSTMLVNLTPASFGLTITITTLTLMLAPGLTANLTDLMTDRYNSRPCSNPYHAEERHSALFGIGALLVLLLVLALNLAVFVFVLLYQGDVPALHQLMPSLLSWHNAPLLILLTALTMLAVLGMQAIGAVPTFLLREMDRNLEHRWHSAIRAVALNWRPLLCWALVCQLLIFIGGGLFPAALLLLAPLIAHGSWWAFREVMLEEREAARAIEV